jgi:hypothetical protein
VLKQMCKSLSRRSPLWLVPIVLGAIALATGEVIETGFSVVKTAGKVMGLGVGVKEHLPTGVVSPIRISFLVAGVLLMVFALPPILRAVSNRRAAEGVALSKCLRDSGPGSLAFGVGLLVVVMAIGMLWGEPSETEETAGGKQEEKEPTAEEKGKGGEVFVIALEGNKAVARSRDGKVESDDDRDTVAQEPKEPPHGVLGIEEVPPSDNEKVGPPCDCSSAGPPSEEGEASEGEEPKPEEPAPEEAEPEEPAPEEAEPEEAAPEEAEAEEHIPHVMTLPDTGWRSDGSYPSAA